MSAPSLPDPPPGFRHWEPDDVDALRAAWQDPEVVRWTGPPEGLDPAHWLAGVDVRWKRRLSLDLVVDVDGAVAGEIGFAGFRTDPERAEIGFWLLPTHRGTGVATRAVTTMTAWAKEELGLEVVVARTDPANRVAGAVLERAGYRHRGRTEHGIVWQG